MDRVLVFGTRNGGSSPSGGTKGAGSDVEVGGPNPSGRAMIKIIIFDYDGVIVDSFPTVHKIYKEICSELGFKCPDSIKEFKKIYGYSAKEAYKNLGMTEKDNQRANALFKKLVITKEPKIFNGIAEVLNELSRKYLLILVTSNLKEEALQK